MIDVCVTRKYFKGPYHTAATHDKQTKLINFDLNNEMRVKI